jgi:cytochrome oxidase Cu insertion factor (SCO1/SenC/PrrC family)
VGNRWLRGAPLAAAVALLVATGCGSEANNDFRGGPPPEGIRLPDFALREHSGATTNTDDLRSKVVLVTFLDTQCTEACPVIAGMIGQSLELLSPSERSEVVALAISSDPEEDTPASVRAFLRRHRVGDTLHYLVGTESELRPVWDAFHVLPSVDTGDDEIHSAPVRLFDRKGVWVATLHAGVDLTPTNLAHDIRVALG